MFPSVWKVPRDSTEPKHVCTLMGKTLETDGGGKQEMFPDKVKGDVMAGPPGGAILWQDNR